EPRTSKGRSMPVVFAHCSLVSPLVLTQHSGWHPLRDGKGNCIDIAVLCANLIKTVKLDPIIVITKNHAFVGWKSYTGSVWNSLSADEQHELQQYEFLDTTWTAELNKTFEDACKTAKDLYEEILANKWLKKRPFNRNGFAQRLDIRAHYKRLEKA